MKGFFRMLVTSMGLLVNGERKRFESTLKQSDIIDDFDIVDLDKNDNKKDIMISFKDPVDIRFLAGALESLAGAAKRVSIVIE